MKNIFTKLLESDYFNLLIDFEIIDFKKKKHREAFRKTLYATGIDGQIADGLINELEKKGETKDTRKTDKNKTPREKADSMGLYSMGRGYWSTKSKEGPVTHRTVDGDVQPISQAEYDKEMQKNNAKNPKAKSTSTSTATRGTESPEPETMVLPAEPLESESEELKKLTDLGASAAIIKTDYDKKQKEKEEKKREEADNTKPQRLIINGKNKSISPGNPLETEEFARNVEPSNQDYDMKTDLENTQLPVQYNIPDFIRNNPKIPARYVDIFERMVNTRATKDTAKYSYFSDIAGGAGQISAQAGELMTLISTTLSDEESEEFFNSLLEHESLFISEEREKVRSGIKSPYVKKDKSGNLIRSGNHYVDLTWIKAARGNRTAIMNRLRKKYGDGVEIVAGAWDSEAEVEALGMSDYKNNKGFSTDVYFRVRKPNGVEFIDEVSLKKSLVVNFLNSGLGKFKDWDSELPESLDQNIYAQKQRDSLSRFGIRYKDKVEKLLENEDSAYSKMILRKMKSLKDPEIQRMVEEKDLKGLFQKAVDDTISGKGSRDKSKIIRDGIWELAASGDQEAQQAKKELTDELDRLVKDSIDAITKNPKLRQGMLDEIKSEFPLKAVSDGEETMAIGELSLDRPTMEVIFGTHEYDDIKEHLSTDPGPPPFLAYDVQGTGERIPVAEISIREDGVGYGGSIKFEMKLHKEFGKVLKEANKKVYG